MLLYVQCVFIPTRHVSALSERLACWLPVLLAYPHNKLYCNGNEASNISIEGGTFRNNKALESGGAIALWGAPTLVTITGGTFENNKAM